MLRLMELGSRNRKVGETLLNKESSRSHSVFTCFIEKTLKSENGVANVITSRLNIIDLAGRHKQHAWDTGWKVCLLVESYRRDRRGSYGLMTPWR